MQGHLAVTAAGNTISFSVLSVQGVTGTDLIWNSVCQLKAETVIPNCQFSCRILKLSMCRNVQAAVWHSVLSFSVTFHFLSSRNINIRTRPDKM